jgi:prepilin-type N-terminal cleavage/methylation domain-containing protein
MFENYCKKGFTLVELLVTIVVLSLVLGAVYEGYSLSQKASREGERAAEIAQNGRVILERIVREIRQAEEIVTELPEGEAGASGEIIFEDGHISDPYHYIHYFKEDTNLCREVVGYYFSDDASQTLVPWDATPQENLIKKTLEEKEIIGEYVDNIKFWNSRSINISLALKKQDKVLNLLTQAFSRNI